MRFQVAVRLSFSPRVMAEQSDLVGEIGSQKPAKESGTAPAPTVGVS